MLLQQLEASPLLDLDALMPGHVQRHLGPVALGNAGLARGLQDPPARGAHGHRQVGVDVLQQAVVVRVGVGDQHPQQTLVRRQQAGNGRQEVGGILGSLERQPQVQQQPAALGLQFDTAPANLMGPSVNANLHLILRTSWSAMSFVTACRTMPSPGQGKPRLIPSPLPGQEPGGPAPGSGWCPGSTPGGRTRRPRSRPPLPRRPGCRRPRAHGRRAPGPPASPCA